MENFKEKLLGWWPILLPSVTAIISTFFTIISVAAIGAVMIYRFQLTEKTTLDLKNTIEVQYKEINDKINNINLSLNSDKIDIINIKDKIVDIKRDIEKQEMEIQALRQNSVIK